MAKVVDRRVQKTRQLLQEALTGLIAEKGYDSITIQHILDRANVGRSTFYAHFQDKEQLLHSCFDSLNGLFEQRTRQLLTADDTQKGTDNMALTLSVFQFAEQNHRFFKTLLGKQSNGMFNKIIYEFMLLHAREHLKLLASRGAVDSFQSEIVAHYFVSAFTGILVWWVTNDMPCSTDEINERFKELAMPAIRSVVG